MMRKFAVLFVVWALVTRWFSFASSTLPIYGKVSSFSLITEEGKQFQEKSLAGKIWISDFIYTRCTDQCPLLSFRMAQLQKAFLNQPNIRLVSFTIDPQYDSPRILKSYGNHFKARADQWIFLTGKQKEIRRILSQNFHVALLHDPAKKNDYVHTNLFALVDQKGNIRGYYDLLQDSESRKKLFQDVAALEK